MSLRTPCNARRADKGNDRSCPSSQSKPCGGSLFCLEAYLTAGTLDFLDDPIEAPTAWVLALPFAQLGGQPPSDFLVSLLSSEPQGAEAGRKNRPHPDGSTGVLRLTPLPRPSGQGAHWRFGGWIQRQHCDATLAARRRVPIVGGRWNKPRAAGRLYPARCI